MPGGSFLGFSTRRYALSLQWLGGSWSLEHNWKTNWVKDGEDKWDPPSPAAYSH